ncbi:LLM class flavin-dependent oxidoreductase [Peribacillus sp. SCS-155]|uniref:LLM class flavin-dependent oxidoreductase n=1 Tax=Peribacillus sedimenti TaxID=3115297 RepID=UPI0039060CD5
MKLSILDQSPISQGMSAEEALQNTVKLAQHAERLGFHRFWVSEHHDAMTLAGTSPEVLIPYLAAKTDRIRVGSGGVMLTHYSAFKVAENFRVMEGLAPGRIDLGIGKAPGGMPIASLALADGRKRDKTRYPEQIDDLLAYLHDALPEGHRFTGLTAAPVTKTAPEVWLLGSTESSALLAAEKGLPYTFAQFINGEDGFEYMERYRQNFKPSKFLSVPKSLAAVFFICAETDHKAEEIASILDYTMLMQQQGARLEGTPNLEQVQAYQYSSFELDWIRENRKRMVVGSPVSAAKQLKELSEGYMVDEMMLVSITFNFEDKVKALRLIVEHFGN